METGLFSSRVDQFQSHNKYYCCKIWSSDKVVLRLHPNENLDSNWRCIPKILPESYVPSSRMTYRNSLSRHALTGGRFQNDLHVNVLFGLYPRPFHVQPKFATICRRYNCYRSQVQMSNRRMASLYSNHHRCLSYAIGRFEPSPSLIQLSL